MAGVYLEGQIPPYEPSRGLSQRDVRVGVRGSRHRDRRCQLGVAQGAEEARDACQHEGGDDGRARKDPRRAACGRRRDQPGRLVARTARVRARA